MLELSKLADKDPEFYKYIQENDRELLDFNMDDDGDVSDNGDDAAGPEGDQLPILTEKILRSWQKSLLDVGFALSRRIFLTKCSVDTIFACISQASHRVPLCCPHE